MTIAVPAGVNCAVPTCPSPAHDPFVVSQKVTRPGVSGVTAAVSVTTVPEATELDDSANVVVVTASTGNVTLPVAVV